MAVLVFLALFLSLTGFSSATYCLCKGGGNDAAYQATIDWACGNGADCRAIQDNGPCFQPNNVKSHCDYAANSYFQKMGQTPESCNFSGTAAPSVAPPSTVPSGCIYASGPGQSAPGAGIPSTSTTPGTTTGTGTGTGAGTGTGTGTGIGTGTGTGSTIPGIYSPPGLAPVGFDPSQNGCPSLLQLYSNNLFSLSLALLPCLLVLWG